MRTAFTRLTLRVSPGSRRTGVIGRHGTGWKVGVAAAPEGGRANEAVVRLLADALSLPRRNISVVAGHRGRDKLLEVAGIAPDETERRLAAARGKERRS